MNRDRINNFIKRNWQPIFSFITIVYDAISILLSGIIALTLRNLIVTQPVITTSRFIFLISLYWLILFLYGLFFGLYRSFYQLNVSQQYKIASRAYIFSVLTVLAIFYLTQITDFPRRFVLFFILILPLFYIFGRTILYKLYRYFQEKGFGIKNVLIFWNDGNGNQILEKIVLFPELGYRIRGIIFNNKHDKDQMANSELLKILLSCTIPELDSVFKREKIDTVLTPTVSNSDECFQQILKKCIENKIRLKIISDESDKLLRFVYLRDIAGIPVYTPPRPKIDRIKFKMKRIFDIVFGLVAIIFFLPFYLIISIAILIEDGFPILYVQKRALVRGKNEFNFYKFRSMIKNAEELQAEMYKKNITTGGLFHMEDDPRITKVGKIIRKLSLDEIPQFFNVIKGDMSLVGPRPLSLADLDNIAPENKIGGFYKLRGNAKPGVTGLWQISGRRTIGFREMVLLDLYYIENQSIVLDLEILFETIPVVLFGRGGY